MGVVGVLQFDVLKYRLENEYNVEIRLDSLPYEYIRWIEHTETDLDKLTGTSDMKKVKDLKDRPLCIVYVFLSSLLIFKKPPVSYTLLFIISNEYNFAK